MQRQLERRFGKLAPGVEARLRSLAIEQVEALGEGLLDFTQPEDLLTWLDQNT
uniref:DUF4351 domain-containing protein n=1 Tax=Trichothermofontia sichuanensis TaxID=3045816 RepID=UPI00249D99BF|nr:DUF4351 domain-containing protein [Trichothermofontia sichuanensis]